MSLLASLNPAQNTQFTFKLNSLKILISNIINDENFQFLHLVCITF